MFVSVRMGGGTLANALLVPERAIGNDQSKRFVFVVGQGDKAEYREVALGSTRRRPARRDLRPEVRRPRDRGWPAATGARRAGGAARRFSRRGN